MTISGRVRDKSAKVLRGHDACELIRDRGWHGDILLSQGDADLGLYVAEQLGKFLQQVRLRPRR